MLTSGRERVGFSHGVLAGFAGCVVLAHLAYSTTLGDLRGMYRDFGGAALPLLTRITIHPAWIWGAPLAGLAAVAALLAFRPRSHAFYIVTAVLVLIVAAASYWYPQAPIRELAGSISNE
ncbi:MAG TPA: hypothetical protein VFS15_19245 [Kofleriaceae bacterium]|nr:hypothetical protein [Kofleriaceae bacterium]